MCSNKITDCQECALKSGTVKCSACGNSKYISIDEESCVADCTGTFISSDLTRCVSNCYTGIIFTIDLFMLTLFKF